MVTIRHILRDGSETDSIEGLIVRVEDAGAVYSLVNRLNQRTEKKRGNGNEEKKQDQN